MYFALKSFGYSTFTQWALSVEALPPTSGLTGYLIRGFRSQGEVATYRRRARLSGETLEAYLSFLSARP